MTLVKRLELYAAMLAICDDMCAEVWRCVEATTSLEQHSTPMDVDGFNAMQGKESSRVKGTPRLAPTQQVSEFASDTIGGSTQHRTIGSCQAKAETGSWKGQWEGKKGKSVHCHPIPPLELWPTNLLATCQQRHF